MIYQTIDLKPDYARAGIPVPNSANAKMVTYILESHYNNDPPIVRPAVVILPGGGYYVTSDRAAEPFASAYNAAGFHAFVVRYSVTSTQTDVRYPGSLLELFTAIATIRQHAEEWFVDPDKIILCGTSAGGHLTACAGIFWNRPEFTDLMGCAPSVFRPNGMILGYPVITSGEFRNEFSFQQLLGDRYDAMKDSLSLENQVDGDTVPTFLWHTYQDTCVPVENALLFACALRRHNIPLEMHIFPRGDHGLALAAEEFGGGPEEVRAWFPLSAHWIKTL